jgi:hypothetical protein
MNITKININDLNEEQKKEVYDMYVKTYTFGKQDIWFKTSDRLFAKYPCLITVDNQYNRFYIMYQLMSNYNKISLIAHDLTRESITELFSMLSHLLNGNGYIMEAAGAVSWKLRQLKTKFFDTKERIENVLDINPNDDKSDKISINTEFLYDTDYYKTKQEIDIQKNNINLNYHYTRSHIDSKTGTIYTNNDTLFGNPDVICDFERSLDCFRKCKNLDGGMYSSNKLKQNTKKIKSKKYKKYNKKSKKYNKKYNKK